jgi:threonine synthase
VAHVFECVDCGRSYSSDQVSYLCPVCGPGNTPNRPPRGVLKTLYDYETLRKMLPAGQEFRYLENRGFLDLLPITSHSSLPNLRIGSTPLYEITSMRRITAADARATTTAGIESTTSAGDGPTTTAGDAPKEHSLFLKDDSVNPTYSLKDRASGLISAVARERGESLIVAASTGNAGSSIAGICASQGQRAVVLVPADAPRAKLVQIAAYGAVIVPVDGSYDEVFELSRELSAEKGWYNRNTAYNPYTIEGKKTVSFEIFGQLGLKAPDAVFVPVGDGVIISGVYKGFEDLVKLGILDEVPRIYAVQSKQSDNLVRNLAGESFSAVKSSTVADSISVDVPRNFRMTKAYLSQYNGRGVVVEDREILEAAGLLSRATGLFAEPAAAAAFAGYLSTVGKREVHPASRCVVLLTGSGLKDLDAFDRELPEAVRPDLGEIEDLVYRQLNAM